MIKVVRHEYIISIVDRLSGPLLKPTFGSKDFCAFRKSMTTKRINTIDRRIIIEIEKMLNLQYCQYVSLHGCQHGRMICSEVSERSNLLGFSGLRLSERRNVNISI